MIEFTHTEAWNFHGALRGSRNSWESHDKSDSDWEIVPTGRLYERQYILGPNDHALLMKLSKAGASHSKYLRQIMICCDINAPLYWWKEFDQYKVGTVTDSESTMHTIMREEFTNDMFSFNDPAHVPNYHLSILNMLEDLRQEYLRTKDKEVWKYLIQILPSSWMQKRTTTLNYQVVKNAYHDRLHHRLNEWHDFCRWAERLPYIELITGEQHE